MADPIGTAGSIVGIVAAGMQLATTLQTYMELVNEAQEALHDIVFDVNATSAALKQLQTIIDSDKTQPDDGGSSRVFRDDGIREIEVLAAKCEEVYKNIIGLLQKASKSDVGEAKAGERKSLVEPALDTSLLKPMTIFRRLKWPWLVPRINRCHEQLRWLKISLLFTLQMANLAQSQLNGKRQAGSFEQELYMREAVETLRKRQKKMMRAMARKVRKDAERRATSLRASVDDESLDDEDVDEIGEVGERGGEGEGEREVHGERRVGVKGDRVTPPQSQQSIALQTKSTAPGSASTNKFQHNVQLAIKGLDLIKPPNQTSPMAQDAGQNPPKPQANTPREQPTSMHTLSIHTQNHTGAPLPLTPEESRPREETPASLQEQQSAAASRHTPTESEAESMAPAFGVFQRKTSRSSGWIRRVFGSKNDDQGDIGDGELEAYITDNAGLSKPTKVPFGEARLKRGLQNVLKRQKGTVLSRYLELSPDEREAVHSVIDAVKKISSHERTCVAFESYGGNRQSVPVLLLFFTLGEMQDPVCFRDPDGRVYSFPYELCRQRQDAEQLIVEVLQNIGADDPLYTATDDKHYDIMDKDLKVILPSLWEAHVKPGFEMSMRMRRVVRQGSDVEGSGTSPHSLLYSPVTTDGLLGHKAGSGSQIPPILRMGGPPRESFRGSSMSAALRLAMMRQTKADQALDFRPPHLQPQVARGMMNGMPIDAGLARDGGGSGGRFEARGSDATGSELSSEVSSDGTVTPHDDVDEDEAEELRVLDIEEEAMKGSLPIGELLGRFTNATDVDGWSGERTGVFDSSSSGGSDSEVID